MDPSLRNWGLASCTIDPSDALGVLHGLTLSVIQPKETKNKQVRQNSKDLEIAKLLAHELIVPMRAAKVVFAEVPVGSQSARAMASYGVCVGILGTMQAAGIQVIEVTALEVKRALTGKRDATKDEMIAAAMRYFPQANWPMEKGRVVASKAEHMADACGAIYAGAQTPLFQNLIRLFQGAT